MTLNNSYKNLMLERDGDWLTIWFNRPDTRNALSAEMIQELHRVIETIVDDLSVRGVTFRGKGGVFCAGGDLKDFKSIFQDGEIDEAEVARSNQAGGELYDKINSLPQVVVMLVDGFAMAGGLGLLCCADVVAVTADAQFALTETTLGIPPAQIAPLIVERMGLRTARRLMLTAARFKGADALEAGLADFMAADGEGLDAIEAGIRKQVSKCAPHANAVTKGIVLATRHMSRDEVRAYAARGFAKCMLGDEGKEGIAAFMEKRKPSWAETGKTESSA